MKKTIFSLLLFVGSIISFGYCVDYMTFDGTHGYTDSHSLSSGVCVRFQTSNCANSTRFEDVNGNILVSSFPNGDIKMNCFFVDGNLISSGNCQVHIFDFSSFYSEFFGISGSNNTGSCDLMTSNECQSNYNLIPISNVDQEYCLGNDLCPEIDNGSGDCENESGNVQWSSLFINDIQHIGAGIINITIPEEISWDYTGDETIFDLDINGYNVNSEYIDGIIRTQNAKPSQGDLNKLVSEVLPLFIPGLAVILLLYFIFRFIKKIF